MLQLCHTVPAGIYAKVKFGTSLSNAYILRKREGEGMDKALVTLEKGTTCSAWNYSGQRLASGLTDGTVAIYNSNDPDSSVFTCSSKFRVHETGLFKIVWVPPEYGDGIACVCDDGTLSLWEEVSEDLETVQWKLCKSFDRNSSRVLDIQFGASPTSLKLVVAYSDGQAKIFELLDPLNLNNWQLQVCYYVLLYFIFLADWITECACTVWH
nr:protein SEH1 [Ipomoea batatas]